MAQLKCWKDKKLKSNLGIDMSNIESLSKKVRKEFKKGNILTTKDYLRYIESNVEIAKKRIGDKC